MPLADVSSEDLDLLMLMPAIPLVGWGPVSQVPVSLGVSTSQSRPVGSDGDLSCGGVRFLSLYQVYPQGLLVCQRASHAWMVSP